MIRAIACLLVVLGVLWARPTRAEACGVKLSLKGKNMKRSVVARASRATPRRALVARRPIRVGPTTRSARSDVVATGGSESSRAAAAPADEEETRVATADTAAKEPVESEAVVEAEAVVEPEPEREPEPREVKPPARFNRRVFFGQANAILSSKAKASLVRNARWLKRHEDRSILVEGHCSVTGPAKPNMDLSEARAEAVKDFLVEMGVDESRIETKGYGLTKPRYKPGSSPKNRRVIIRVRKD
jgi:outer membrane protein OmpA-like peptidoglycan-associated protein